MTQHASRLLISAALVSFALVPRVSFAQDVPSLTESARAAVSREVTQTPTASQVTFAPPAHEFPKFSPTMQSLYFTTAYVQFLDARTTFKALDLGASEQNSIVKPFANNRPAFAALKIGMAAAFIYQGHQMSKTHKLGAIIALGLVNSLYTAIAINNYHVIHAMQAQGR